MQEIELKFLDIDVTNTIIKLEQLGAKKVFEGELDATYFAGLQLESGKNTLRIRKEGERTFITHKTHHEHTKYKGNEETELEITDFEKMKHILLSLGFTIEKEIKKHRISYWYDDIYFEFDTLPNIPTFLEIEAQSEEKL